MNRKRLSALHSCAAFALSVLAAPPGHAEEAATAESANATEATGELIVTARRRDERLKDVPISISVLGGPDLDQRGVKQFEALQYSLPNTSIYVLNPRQTNITIRGIGFLPASSGVENSVGVYEDGVYLGRQGMAIFDLLNIERIEVLRGPQGTLFGKNSTAGAISVVTSKPSFDPAAKVEATVGNYDARRFEAYATGPIAGDTIAASIAGYYNHRDGFVIGNTTGRRYNGVRRWGVRGQIYALPTDTLDLRLIASHGREKEPNGALVLFNPGANNGQAFYAAAARLGFTPAPAASLRTDLTGPQYISTRQTAVTLEANWRPGGGDTKITSLSAFRSYQVHPQNDSDFTPIDAIRQLGTLDHVRQFSQELRLASPTGQRIDYVVGAYYLYLRIHAFAPTVYGSQADIFRGTTPGTLNLVTSITESDPTTNSYALFGQATLHIVPRLDLTGGLRQTWEKKNALINRFLPTGPTNVSAAALTARLTSLRAFSADVTRHDNNLSVLATLSYKPSRDTLLYATYSRGAKGGGINPSVPPVGTPNTALSIKPEKVRNFEVGAKFSPIPGLLEVDASLFSEHFSNYQATSYLIPGVQLLTNAGKVKTQGGEVQLQLTPARGLSINASGGYLDAHYVSFTTAPCPAGTTTSTGCNLTGRRLQGASKWSVNLIGNYTRLLNETLSGYVSASYSYKSAYYGNLDDSDFARIKGYSIVNGRIGLATGSGFDVSVFADNLFDKRYFHSITSLFFGAYYGFPGQPRTFGATVKKSF